MFRRVVETPYSLRNQVDLPLPNPDDTVPPSTNPPPLPKLSPTPISHQPGTQIGAIFTLSLSIFLFVLIFG